MSAMTDQELDALQERLKEQEVWGKSILDTLVVWRKERQEANAVITALRRELALVPAQIATAHAGRYAALNALVEEAFRREEAEAKLAATVAKEEGGE
jgi:DMSO/TMAO reductase YedYZ heme-binding membrane subunit